MKKLLRLIVTCALAASFVACSGESQEEYDAIAREKSEGTQSLASEQNSLEIYYVGDFSIQIPSSWTYDKDDINDYYVYKDGAFLSANSVDLAKSEGLDLKSFMTIYVDTLEKSKHSIISKDLIELPNTEAYKVTSAVNTSDKQLNYQIFIVKSDRCASIFSFIQSESIDEDFNEQIKSVIDSIAPLDGVNETQDSRTLEDDLKEAENRAKEISNNLKSAPIIEGDIFDEICRIYNEVDIYETREKSTNKPYTLSIKYKAKGGDTSENSKQFMNFVEESYKAINFENSEYKNIAYDFQSNEAAICMLFITKEDNGKITTSSPVIMDENFRETIENEYSSRTFFISMDILENYKKDLSEIENSIE